MNSTIQMLKQKLEELKKRLKTITSSQNTMSAILEIKDYIKTIQEYLNTIDQNYTSHLEECSSHTTQIEDINIQIEDIYSKLETGTGTGSNVDVEELQNSINSLNSQINTIEEQIEQYKKDCQDNFLVVSNDISDLQSEVSSNTQNISSQQNEINQINSSVGSLQTNIHNLNTSQTNQNTTIDSINTRLSSAEANISTLTGGVDVSAIEERLAKLELFSGSPSVLFKKTDLNWVCNNNTNFFYENFSCVAYQSVHIHLKLTFSNLTNKNVTIQLVSPNQSNKILAHNASDEGVFECAFSYLPKYNSNNIGIGITCDKGSILTDYELEIFGTNLKDMEYQKEFSVCCFDGYIYISQQYSNYLWYGKFSSTDDINLYELPERLTLGDGNISRTRTIFMPYVKAYADTEGVKRLESLGDVFLSSNLNGYVLCEKVDPENTSTLPEMDLVTCNYFPDPVMGQNSYVWLSYLVYDRPGIKYCENGQIHYDVDDVITQEFIKMSMAKNNNRKTGDPIITTTNSFYVCQSKDGYIYLLRGTTTSPLITKVCKGEYATAYTQPDGSVNIYVRVEKNIHKYKGYATTENGVTTLCTTYITQINNAECVFELLNNKIMYKRFDSNFWYTKDLEY